MQITWLLVHLTHHRLKKLNLEPMLRVIKKIKKLFNIPVVAIGGINNVNYKKLLLNKADFLAISGYVWNNKKLKPTESYKIT
jgi:thiamine-phosphate pyrophosphorylase